MGCFGCRDGRITAYFFAYFGFVCNFLAFSTPYWLKSDFRAYSAEFLRTGLWETCFRSHASPEDLELRKFYVGCRWILTYEYNTLRDTIELPFFITTQVFYTFAFTAHLVAAIGLLSIYVCFDSKYELRLIRWSTALLSFASFCSIISVIVFGALANEEGWMPDPMHNYLSWSFASAVIGGFCELVAAILLQVDSRHVLLRNEKRNQHVHTFG